MINYNQQFWVGAIRESPLRDVSHSFFNLILDNAHLSVNSVSLLLRS